MNLPLANANCVGHNDLCKMVSPNNSESPEIEPDYIETDKFTPNIRIGEPKVSADKVQNPNNSDFAYNESHGNDNHGIFCVTRKDSELIDIESIFNDDKNAM